LDFTAAAFGSGDLNGLDGARCDAFGVASVSRLPAFFVADLPGAALRDFAAGFLAALTERARVALAVTLAADVLGDFLRVFLDIRLPFVAFDGSIIGYGRSCSGKCESSLRLGKSDGLGVSLQGIRIPARPPVSMHFHGQNPKIGSRP
jgi:hypothetical protein